MKKILFLTILMGCLSMISCSIAGTQKEKRSVKDQPTVVKLSGVDLLDDYDLLSFIDHSKLDSPKSYSIHTGNKFAARLCQCDLTEDNVVLETVPINVLPQNFANDESLASHFIRFKSGKMLEIRSNRDTIKEIDSQEAFGTIYTVPIVAEGNFSLYANIRQENCEELLEFKNCRWVS